MTRTGVGSRVSSRDAWIRGFITAWTDENAGTSWISIAAVARRFRGPARNDAVARRIRTSTAAALVLTACTAVALSGCQRSTLPATLSDAEFRVLLETLSEPAGTFDLSDNLVSNEPRFAENVRWLRASGGVYIGVGPEQNFSYIAQLRPAIAFIVDIRTENRNLHLLYKALFELSLDRSEFVSRLFSRPRPDDLGSGASVDEIFSRYADVPPSLALYEATLALIRDRLVAVRALPLAHSDLESIERVLKAFLSDGPSIDFWGSRAVDADTLRPSYRELMTARDIMGHRRSFLASDDAFNFVKDLHLRNRIVPVVGDFAGARALKSIGDYIRRHRDVVRAFYGSNVGVYLNNQQTRVFCGNLANLPAAPGAWFIESDGVRTYASKLASCAPFPK